jgi:GxxExxY protein
LTRAAIGAAIEVHRFMGPGLIESIYERCLIRELELRQIGAHPSFLQSRSDEPTVAAAFKPRTIVEVRLSSRSDESKWMPSSSVTTRRYRW